MPTKPNATLDFDTAYMNAMNAIEDFFRYAKRHPDVQAELNEVFDEAYYERVAATMKKRIDHELKYLHNPHLD